MTEGQFVAASLGTIIGWLLLSVVTWGLDEWLYTRRMRKEKKKWFKKVVDGIEAEKAL